jgi:hypothetical protein
VEEYVPPEIYSQFGDKAIRFIHPNVIIVSNIIRDYFNREVTINDWIFNGKFKYRCLRTIAQVTDPLTGEPFASKGEHFFGTTFDFHVEDISAEEVRNEIVENTNVFCLVNRIKMYPTFNHIEVKLTNDFDNTIIEFR